MTRLDQTVLVSKMAAALVVLSDYALARKDWRDYAYLRTPILNDLSGLTHGDYDALDKAAVFAETTRRRVMAEKVA